MVLKAKANAGYTKQVEEIVEQVIQERKHNHISYFPSDHPRVFLILIYHLKNPSYFSYFKNSYLILGLGLIK